MAGGRRAPGSHACPSASLDQGLFHSKRGSEQNQPPAIPPPLCLAWGLTFHTQGLRARPWEPACLGAHPWPHHSPAGQVPALLGALPASPAQGRQGHLPRAGYVSQSALRSTGRYAPRLGGSHFHTLMGMGVVARPGPASLWDKVFCHCSATWTAETGEKERTLQDSFLKILHVLLSCPQRGGLSRNQEK